MTTADLIEQVLQPLSRYDIDLPEAVASERRTIRERYDELKRTISFSDSAAQARREAVERILANSLPTICLDEELDKLKTRTNPTQEISQ